MRLKILLSLCLFIYWPPAFSQDEQGTAGDYKSVPKGFENYLLRTEFLEGFKTKIFNHVRSQKFLNNTLTKEEFHKYKTRTLDGFGLKQAKYLSKYDLNSDSKIEKTEIEKYIKSNDRVYKSVYDQKGYIKKAIRKKMLYDLNKDGSISYKEMKHINVELLSEREQENLKSEWLLFEHILQLDPDENGVVTYDELDLLLPAIFDLVDLNHDGIISEDERKLYKEYIQPPRRYHTPAVRQNEVVQRKQEQLERCKFDNLEIPEDLIVYAAGAYKGRTTEHQIDSARKVTSFEVVVNEKNGPVALILGAYDSSIWNIRISPETNLIGVIVGGYNRQVVAGIKKSIPVLYSSHKNHDACGLFFFTITNPETIAKASVISDRAFNKPVKMFYPLENEKTGEIIIGDPNYDESKLLFSEDNAPHTYYSKTTPLSGKKGIEFALKKGFIRKSTEAEIKKWNEERRLIDLRMAHKYSKKEGYGPPLLKVPRWSYTILTDGYVIPADTRASFIVLEGENLPLAKFGDASVYDMNTMQCYTSSPVDGCRKVREPVAKNDNIKKK